MQLSFPISVTFLHVLLTSITPVISKRVLTQLESDDIVKENEPFELACRATDNQELTKSITWKGPDDKTDIQNTSDTKIMEIKSEDKKTIKSTLTVSKPPKQSRLFYYCFYDNSGSPKTFSLSFLEDGSIPVVTIINRTTSRELQFVEAKVGERVTLVCQISYKNFITDPSFFTLSLIWQKEGVEGNLTEKKPQYKTGNHTEIIEYRTTVGGSYHCQSLFSFPERKYERNASVELRILPERYGEEREVKYYAGDDVNLKCDIVGYPLVYEWQFEDGTKITADVNSRFSVKKDVLSIRDITYSDRKKYICVADYDNGKKQLKQTIILRVKDPKAPLWPFLGILAEVVVIAAVILGAEYYKSRRRSEIDGGSKVLDAEETPTTLTNTEPVKT